MIEGDALLTDAPSHIREQGDSVKALHAEHKIIASLKFDFGDFVLIRKLSHIAAQCAEGSRSQPGEHGPGVPAKMDKSVFEHTRVPCHGTGQTQSFESIRLQIGVFRVLGEHPVHPLQNPCVDLAVVARPLDLHLSLDGMDVDEPMGNIQLLHLPHTARQGEPIPHRGCGGDGADLVGTRADGEILRVLEYGEEFEAGSQFFTSQAHDQFLFFRHLQKFLVDHGFEQQPILILGDMGKGRQGQHPLTQRHGSQGSTRCQNGDGLLEQETERTLSEDRRLNKPILNIQLYDGNRLEKFPGDQMGQGRVWQRLLFAEHHHHLRGIFPTAASPQPLQKGRYGVGRAQLDHPLQLADVDAQFHGHRGAGHRLDLLILHLGLRLLPDGGGQIAVVDEEHVTFTPSFGDLPQGGGHVLRLLPGVGEDQGFAALGGVVDVFVSRVG